MKRSVVSFLFCFLVSCGGVGGGGSGSGQGGTDNCFNCSASNAAFLHLDTENVAALLSIDRDTQESSALSTAENLSTGKKKPSPIQGIDQLTGQIRHALRCFSKESGNAFDKDGSSGLSADCWGQVPRIVTVAQCGGNAYLVFEHPFIVRTVTPDGKKIEDYSDPWSPSSPFTSQLLRSKVPVTNYKAGDRIERANLEGVLYKLEVNTWDRRRNIQFDGSCNLYVTGHVSGTSRDVLVKIAPGAAEDTYTEVINANICYERYLVTSKGDVHYTGRTGKGASVGQDCSGDSFYRMVSGAGLLTEITRGWWDYQFEPQDDGAVVFYGPDPTSTGVPSWDSACLFKFDGGKSGDARYSKLVNCINDWNRYVHQGASSEFATSSNNTEQKRCAEQFYTYRSSHAPGTILSIDRDGDGVKEICTVTNVEYKQAGSWKCDICVNSGSNCENSAGMITGDTTQASCEATKGNTWVGTNKCYNDVTTGACTITAPSGWKLNHDWCQDPGSNWSQTYKALSCIKSDKSVELISPSSETVTNAWVIGKRLLYSSVEGGTYHLKAVSFDKKGSATVSNLQTGIEIYEISVDPTVGTDRILLNGLRFSDNSYVFGHYDFTTGTLDTNTGLTGLVQAILVLGP